MLHTELDFTGGGTDACAYMTKVYGQNEDGCGLQHQISSGNPFPAYHSPEEHDTSVCEPRRHFSLEFLCSSWDGPVLGKGVVPSAQI